MLRRILVTLLLPIGDTLFATPALHALRKAYPSAHIAALVFPTNAGVLEGNPDIDEVLVHPHVRQPWQFGALLRVLRALRERRFELVVEMNWGGELLGRLAAHNPLRVSLPYPRGWWLVPRGDDTWARKHAVEHYLDVLRPLGIREEQPRLRFVLHAQEEAFARMYLQHHRVPEGEMLIALHPGGEGFGRRKRWPAERFVELGAALIERHKAHIVVLGGPQEEELGEQIAQRILRRSPDAAATVLNAAGRTTLRQAAALIARCSAFVGNDSSLLHLANALGVPAVGIYGPSNPVHFRPFMPGALVVQPEDPYTPCFHFAGTDPLWRTWWYQLAPHRTAAMERITVAQVLQAVEALLATARIAAPAGR